MEADTKLSERQQMARTLVSGGTDERQVMVTLSGMRNINCQLRTLDSAQHAPFSPEGTNENRQSPILGTDAFKGNQGSLELEVEKCSGKMWLMEAYEMRAS